MGNPVNLSIMLKYLFRYLLKLLLSLLYSKQKDIMDHSMVISALVKMEIIRNCSITIMTKDELGDQVLGNALKI